MNLLYYSKIHLQKSKGMLLLVNKNNPLPKDYRPWDMRTPKIAFASNDNFEKTLLRKEASYAIEDLFHAAKKDNIALYGISFFRPYFRQHSIYRSVVDTKGEEYANSHVAKPGFSEHQSGLSADLSSKSANLELIPSFGTLPEGLWLEKNAHKYGFILRYPLGKEAITGYSYEPWHFRYVGKCIASNIFQNKLTLEEWYDINQKYFS